MERVRKEAFVAELNQTLRDTPTVLLAHYKGLSVAEMGELRRDMRNAGARFRVTKNRLARRAVADTKYAPLADMFNGPTAIAYADDPVALAKAAVDYARKNGKLVVLGGAIGEDLLDADAVRTLAALPSLEVLRATIVGLLQAPATSLAVLLQAPAAQIARVIAARAETEAETKD